jgi:glycosyltransferase involved in cell wall biosynthesis
MNRENARKFLAENLKINPGRETVWLGTISELHKNKGLEYAIEAMGKIKELPFILIIIGEGELRENLKAQIAKLNLENKVFLFGYLDEARKYLPAFDIFTLTSITEALNYAIMEAGLAGLPVIASDVGGIREIIASEKDGFLLESKKPEKIAAAVSKLINNPQMRKILGENLKKIMQEKFSAQQMLEKTIALY